MDRPAATSVLCEKCHGLCGNGEGWCWVQQFNGKKYPSVYLHHPSLHVLKAKAVEGCALCSMILRTLVEYCKIDAESYESNAKHPGRKSLETTDDIKRIVSRVQDTGILHRSTSRRGTSVHKEKRTHTFHPAFDQEKVEKLRSVFGSERVLMRARTLHPKNASDQLPDSLSVIWLGSIETCLSRNTTGLDRIRVLVDYDDTLGHLSQPGGIRPEPSLLSNTHLRRISSWRKKCSQEHDGCPGDEEPRELPTRVIAVNSNDPRFVKLVNTHRGRSAVYACLSYSWGTGTQHCTTTRNIQNHLQGIPISDLPETVADAIKLCRALRIPYLWVDALCIIQDDHDDWSREAAAMARIYGSSVLTISVPDTSDCTEQFLTRSLDKYSSAEVEWVHGPSGTVGTATLVYDWPRDQSALLSKSPWMERGWTFQEWVLSPCVLHCGSTTTIYECLHGTCYETHDADEIGQSSESLDLGHVVNTKSLQRPAHSNTWPTDAKTAREQSGTVEVDNTARLFERVIRLQHGHAEIQTNARGPSWSDVVAQFCGRQLTKDTDKLPALAGLAARFQSYKCATLSKEGTYDYLAGLWWDGGSPTLHQPNEAAELPTGLLWRRTGDEFLSRPAAYRAPSWSWAAFNGPIEFLGLFAPVSSKLQIHDAVCIYDYPDSLSSVKTGWIDATGPLRRVWPMKTQGHIDLRTKEDDGDQDGDNAGKDNWWCVRFDERVSGPRWREMQRLEIFLLLVATCCVPDSPRVTHHALVLKRVAAEKAAQIDCFTRLGTALKNHVSQHDLPKRCGNHDDGKEKIFRNWDHRKLRLL